MVEEMAILHLIHGERAAGVGAEEESDHGAGGPDVFAAQGGVFEAGHEFEAVFGDVAGEADVGGLIEVA